jgi:hypothetical protein
MRKSLQMSQHCAMLNVRAGKFTTLNAGIILTNEPLAALSYDCVNSSTTQVHLVAPRC